MRLLYLKNYYEINMIPNLHTNQISLIDQKHTENYLAIKQDQDAFYALTNELGPEGKDESLLITWDITTGKKMHEHRCSLSKQNFMKYQRYKG